jgi:hypothetical protein
MGLTLPNEIIETAGVCQNCFIKFNEIDEHQMIADKIQLELVALFNSNSATMSEVKVEDSGEEAIKMELNHAESYEGEEIVEEFFVENEEEIFLTPDDNLITASPTNEGKRIYNRRKDPDEGLTVVTIGGERLYQCDICKRVCKDRYKLRNHRETHQTVRSICCNECGAMFKTLGCLYSHRKLHKERTYHDCDLCGMKYVQKTQLRKHMEAIHLKRKDYVCMICGKISEFYWENFEIKIEFFREKLFT